MPASQNLLNDTLRAQYKVAHDTLVGTTQGLTAEQAHWTPAGRAMPIAAHYAHVIASEDFLVNVLIKGGAPIARTSLEGKTGISEPPPPGDWSAWARQVRLDLPAAQAYAHAVFAATDAFLANLTPEQMATSVDLSAIGLGQQTVGYVVAATLLNSAWHTGEIACLKGLQGEAGYPF